MICVGEGRFCIKLFYQDIGEDKLIIITGGEKEHIGSATLIEIGGFVQSFSKKEHKDYIVSEKIANIIYEEIGKELVVICGIHIDNASKEEINILIGNTQKCVNIFGARLV